VGILDDDLADGRLWSKRGRALNRDATSERASLPKAVSNLFEI